ncbi:hypothetical protein [Rhodobacter capsulatus]|jgi:hypothetical protein|uniref:Uncharacterized protein n=1 Tax=Rhodobacter capsulatus (strain ATCC BAA-309 / NBRC 16581 / SB1003) TaxID=272942 RepID=D5AQE7_RHOCB|nr:hypothetical protein [Rhodobacter capsulatus]ADE86736.1 conserved hypothetical protein [Rhodobacter capsulatus SB 1003]ETD00297.1 hypothetical protein U714_16470 [Rhodobacter capsulatus DE442]ETD74637.1 hypothetical protein U717_16435 [Rhodobacter capsulatus R121]ETE52500.1 hypothetical protein U715_16430 [Rhodobacter capsulatus Y262]MDS0928536.1 hypothetical protein [Rhodobacter capsulatus]
MKSSLPLIALAVLLSSTVVGALSAAPIDAPVFAGNTAAALATSKVAASAQGSPAQPVQLADNDHDDDDDDDGFFGWFGHHGHHGHHDDDDDDDDHGRRNCPPGATGCGAAPAAAGTVAPPSNGLFAPGSKPQVQTN